MRSAAGNQIAEETIVHIREEYSTWDWIITGMIEKAGFHIDNNSEIMQNVHSFICTKK
jgi:putative AdoMet-dependent methyltransferase